MHIIQNVQELLKGDAFLFAQRLDNSSSDKPVYTMQDAISVAGSAKTAYRRLNALQSLGLAKYRRGSFILKTNVVSQPANVIEKLLPSLVALSKARRFGRNYNDSDIRFAMQNISDKVVTLDYKAYELTKFQTPLDLYIYVQDVDQVASFLKEKGFREGKNGRVVILPKMGDFENEIERVYLDCMANGERSTMDAIAIELLYEGRLKTKGLFPIQLVKKVQEDSAGGKMTDCLLQ
ncbi:hypothetical protein NVIE_021460 [Nitrososphaera viennensis EN76]|uniref:Uncharacterized protein n=1 Tax=Nitrososphaera viennensis EN76 TaxID=926571 RepID=A0A060HMR3_9ARCH|nr:hypothetical protein NVIE_021460 [Nitrososphaera viennensis EN76]